MMLFAILFDVLVLGQGILGPDVPRQIEAALRASGVAARVEGIGGEAPAVGALWADADGAAAPAAARVAAGTADAVVIAAPPDADDPAGAVRRLHALATGVRPDASVWLVSPLPPGPAGGADWRVGLDRAAAETEGVADAVNALRAPGVPPLRILPLAEAMALVADRAAAGQVPGLASAADLVTAQGGLNDRGEYLAAIVAQAALSGRSPEGLPPRLRRLWTNRDTVVTPPMAAALQAAARTAVERAAARPAAEPVPAGSAAAGAPVPPAAGGHGVAGGAPASHGGAAFYGIANPNLAIGLSAVTDWTAAQPFVDVFRTARPWTGHLAGRYGGFEHDALAAGGWLTSEGWLRAIPPEVTHVSALILTDQPEDAVTVAGRYRVTWAGRGRILVAGRATTLSQGPGEIWFDYVPGPGTVALDIVETDPADPIRDIAVVHEANLAAHAAGEIFDPRWLSRLQGVRLLRFMDWTEANNSRVTGLDDRPRPTDYTWGRIGVPIEIQIALANRLGADAWFTIPHLADDDLIRHYATLARDTLDPGLKAYVELSNEVWNWMFAQARWADAQGRARWRREATGVQYYSLRASEMADIWTEVFGPAGKGRLVRVIATQTGWMGLEDQILNAPEWAREVGRGFVPPWQRFDAYAVTGYFSGNLGSDEKAPTVRRWIEESRIAAERDATARGLTGTAWAAHVDRHAFDRAVTLAAREVADGSVTGDAGDTLDRLLRVVLPYHAEVARRHGLRLAMYEGGTHVVGYGRQQDDPALTAFFVHFNYTAEMGALYRRLLEGWAALTAEPFNNFGDVVRPGKYGSWGGLRHVADDNPRWRALVAVP